MERIALQIFQLGEHFSISLCDEKFPLLFVLSGPHFILAPSGNFVAGLVDLVTQNNGARPIGSSDLSLFLAVANESSELTAVDMVVDGQQVLGVELECLKRITLLNIVIILHIINQL